MDRLKQTLKVIIGAQKAIAKAFVGSALVLYGMSSAFNITWNNPLNYTMLPGNQFVGIILVLQGIQGGGLKTLRKHIKRVQESVEKTKNAVKSVASDYKSEKAFNSVVTALDPKRTSVSGGVVSSDTLKQRFWSNYFIAINTLLPVKYTGSDHSVAVNCDDYHHIG
jgi:hypothetical protein